MIINYVVHINLTDCNPWYTTVILTQTSLNLINLNPMSLHTVAVSECSMKAKHLAFMSVCSYTGL